VYVAICLRISIYWHPLSILFNGYLGAGRFLADTHQTHAVAICPAKVNLPRNLPAPIAVASGAF
jgi:hypothetical protein